MKYMLDTNICIYLIKQQPREVIEKFQGIALGEIAVSTVTVAEMLYGVGKIQYKEKNNAALQAFLAPLEIVDFDFAAAQQYGVVADCVVVDVQCDYTKHDLGDMRTGEAEMAPRGNHPHHRRDHTAGLPGAD